MTLNSTALPENIRSNVIAFFAAGEPKAQPRPKAFARKFGEKWMARVYTPGTCEEWKSQIAMAVKEHLPKEPLTGPVEVTIDLFFPRPKAHYRSNGDLKPNAPSFHVSKPDTENCAKGVLDSLTQVGVWRDDSQVCSLRTRKQYCGLSAFGGGLFRPGAQITIQPLDFQPLRPPNGRDGAGVVQQIEKATQ